MIIALILAAVLTCVIELPIIYCSFKKEQCPKLVSNIILINLITNLTLNILNIFIGSISFVIGAELLIPAIEAVMYQYCYHNIKIGKLLIVCYIANAISFGLGLLIL